MNPTGTGTDRRPDSTRERIGSVLMWLGFVSWFAFGLWALALNIRVIDPIVGGFWTTVAMVFFPVLLGLVPWYALFAHGDWLPLAVTYGGITLSVLIVTVGRSLAKVDEPPPVPPDPTLLRTFQDGVFRVDIRKQPPPNEHLTRIEWHRPNKPMQSLNFTVSVDVDMAERAARQAIKNTEWRRDDD